ncbi:MAG: hypothetical protein ACI81S_002332 [Sphingobacteriales bacterium]|jgi:hypothetical protein
MENKTMPSENKKKSVMLYVVIGILVITNVLTFLQMEKKTTQLDSSETDRMELQMDVQKLQVELDSASAQMTNMDAEMVAKNEELQKKIDMIQGLLRRKDIDAKKIKDYKNDIDQLRYYIEKYQTEIKVLKEDNAKLTNENSGLKETVVAEQRKSSDLLNENIGLSNKVEVAKILKTSGISVIPVRVRRNGEEKETDRARSVEKIKVCYTFADNPIASQGDKVVYLRVINPEGNAEVITDDTESKFSADGNDMQYSAKITLNFKNDGKENCMYWMKASNYAKGTYKVFLYSEQSEIGSSSFGLK